MDSKKAQRELKQEINLADAAESDDRRSKVYTFGTIIDICEPFKFEDKDQFVTKIKIIDPTFNFKAYIANKDIKFHKFVTVHLYSETAQEAPKAKNVGDIIRLRRFHFVLTDKGELIAYETHFSNWLIYKGERNETLTPTNFKAKWVDKNVSRHFTPYETKRLQQLREWNYNFFRQHKIKFITWWSPLIEPQNEEQAVADRISSTDVDIILKATQVETKKNQISFVDHGGKKYLLALKANPVLQADKVIKLRCINVIYTRDIRLIQLTQKSSCLIIPDYFYDAVAFTRKPSPKGSVSKTPERFSKTPDKNRSRTPPAEKKSAAAKSKSPTPSRAAKAGDWTDEYDISKREGVTAIKRQSAKQKVTEMRTLLHILSDPKQYEHRRFIVRGYILGFSDEKIGGIAKKMAGGKVQGFDTKAKNVSNYIFHFTINLKDASLEDTDETLNAYVLTNEGDQHLFDQWNLLPSQSDVAAWEGLSKHKISAFEKRFSGLKAGSQSSRFVLELLITPTGKPFFKVYDTIFV